MSIDQTKIHSSIAAATKLFLDAGLTGEEYLLVLQTMVAHVLAANPTHVKKIFLLNLNADVRQRRIVALNMKQVAQ